MRTTQTLLLSGSTVFLFACGDAAPTAPVGSSTSAIGAAVSAVQVWITSDPAAPFEAKPDTRFSTSTASSSGVIIDESATNLRAVVDGFGAAFTDASAAILQNYLSPKERASVLADLISPTSGLGLSVIRLPMAASDSTWAGAYSYDDDGPDPTMAHFSIEHDKAYIIPELKEILAINPDVHVIATPWSPPAWMKTGTTTMNRGNLNPADREAYAEYFVHFIRAYWEQEPHIPIYAITPQNEPGELSDYPSMSLPSADEATFIVDYLAPRLEAANFGWVKIFGFDHNWGSAYPSQLLFDVTAAGGASMLQGMAFHCYGGNHSAALSTLHAQSPNLEIYLTECDRSVYEVRDAQGQYQDSDDDGPIHGHAEGIENLIYAMNNWSRSYLAWQLILEPDGEPNQGHGCMGTHDGRPWHCVGVESVFQSGKVRREWDYAYLGHASKFVQRGAQTVAVKDFGSIESVAFINPDQSRVLVAYNAGSDETFSVSWNGQVFAAMIPAKSAATFRWQ